MQLSQFAVGCRQPASSISRLYYMVQYTADDVLRKRGAIRHTCMYYVVWPERVSSSASIYLISIYPSIYPCFQAGIYILLAGLVFTYTRRNGQTKRMDTSRACYTIQSLSYPYKQVYLSSCLLLEIQFSVQCCLYLSGTTKYRHVDRTREGSFVLSLARSLVPTYVHLSTRATLVTATSIILFSVLFTSCTQFAVAWLAS